MNRLQTHVQGQHSDHTDQHPQDKMTNNARFSSDQQNISSSLRWAINVSELERSSHEWEQSFSLFEAKESKDLPHYRHVRDKHQSLLGRLMMRRAASDFMGVDMSKVCIRRTKEGKPYISDQGCPGLNLNVSHHGEWVFMGMEKRGIIGVDVAGTEAPRKGVSADDYVESFHSQFSQKERQSIRAGASDEEKYFAFAVMWALKESVAKAVGTGLAFGLERLEFSVSAHLLTPAWWASAGSGMLQRDGVQVRVDGELQTEWEFELGVLGTASSSGIPPYVVATAVGPFSKASLASRAEMELPVLDRRTSVSDSTSAFYNIDVISLRELFSSADSNANETGGLEVHQKTEQPVVRKPAGRTSKVSTAAAFKRFLENHVDRSSSR